MAAASSGGGFGGGGFGGGGWGQGSSHGGGSSSSGISGGGMAGGYDGLAAPPAVKRARSGDGSTADGGAPAASPLATVAEMAPDMVPIMPRLLHFFRECVA